MRKYKIIDEPYIVAIGDGIDGIEIPGEEYDQILSIIQMSKANPPEGKMWRLRADTLEYELVDKPYTPLTQLNPKPDYEQGYEDGYDQSTLDELEV